MSRCDQTDAILQLTFADRDLTQAHLAHVASCAECARVAAEALRFDRALWRVGSDVTGETLPPWPELNDTHTVAWEGRRMSARSAVAGAGVALVVALLVFGGGTWLGSRLSGGIDAGKLPAEVLDAWVEAAQVTAVAQARIGPREPAAWEAVQVEACGSTAIAFYSNPNRSAGYVWVIGRPREPASRVLDSGRAARLEDTEVAQLRSLLPICDVVHSDSNGPAAVLRALPAEAQTVVFMAAFHWSGAPEDAPIQVDGPDDVAVGVRQAAFLQGVVDDGSVRAVDIITEAGRMRFPASVPGFVAETNLKASGMRFEYRDSVGRIVAAGSVVELGQKEARGALEAHARAEVLAEAERRALETGRPGTDCATWARLTDVEQVTIAAVVIPDLERVRLEQRLPAGSSPAQIVASARASIGKACQGSPDDRGVADVARGLYGGR